MWLFKILKRWRQKIYDNLSKVNTYSVPYCVSPDFYFYFLWIQSTELLINMLNIFFLSISSIYLNTKKSSSYHAHCGVMCGSCGNCFTRWWGGKKLYIDGFTPLWRYKPIDASKNFVDGPALYKCLSLGRGRMRVVQRSGPGYYPIAMIPGQFVDSYKVNGIKISLHLRVIFLECLPTKCNNWGRANVILGILFSKGYCGSGSDTLVYL